jgi:ABC-2 type transport system permease protein
MPRKLWAFYKRDFQLALSNRFQFFYSTARTILSLVSFFFIGKLLVEPRLNPHLAAYQGDYFRFVLAGVAFSGFMSTALSSFSRMIQFERWHGTLEEILLTPTSFLAMALGKTLWDLTALLGQVGLTLFFGRMLFHVDLAQANWLALIPAVALTIGTFLGVGMISAGCSLLRRDGGMVEQLLGGTSLFFAGVYFPVSVLPEGIRWISNCLPLTYSLEAVRKFLLQGSPLSAVGKELAVLAGFTLIFLPAGILFFRWALRAARHQGVLALA